MYFIEFYYISVLAQFISAICICFSHLAAPL